MCYWGFFIGFIAFFGGYFWGYDRGYAVAMKEAYEAEYGEC